MTYNSPENGGEPPIEPWAQKAVEHGIDALHVGAATITLVAARLTLKMASVVATDMVQNGIAYFISSSS